MLSICSSNQKGSLSFTVTIIQSVLTIHSRLAIQVPTIFLSLWNISKLRSMSYYFTMAIASLYHRPWKGSSNGWQWLPIKANNQVSGKTDN